MKMGFPSEDSFPGRTRIRRRGNHRGLRVNCIHFPSWEAERAGLNGLDREPGAELFGMASTNGPQPWHGFRNQGSPLELYQKTSSAARTLVAVSWYGHGDSPVVLAGHIH